MEEKRETIKHTRMMIDGQFNDIMEEIDDMTDEDVIDSIFIMANMLFRMADKFGYAERIENVINKHYGDKL